PSPVPEEQLRQPQPQRHHLGNHAVSCRFPLLLFWVSLASALRLRYGRSALKTAHTAVFFALRRTALHLAGTNRMIEPPLGSPFIFCSNTYRYPSGPVS